MKTLFALLLCIGIHLISFAQDSSYSIIGVGDIMLGTDFPSKAYLPKSNDCTPLLADVKDILVDADVTFGNLEGAFADNAPVTKRCKDPKVCYAFRTPTKYFQCLIDAGFDIFSLANNHSGDLGAKGRNSTISLIEKAGLHHAGLLSHPTAIFEKDSIKYGLAAFSPNNGTCRINNYKAVKRIITELDKKVDIIIVSFHGGAEGRKHQHVPKKREIFYGENRGNVHEFARVAIDAGADIIFGHGPHVTRAVDVYKNRFISYSLGNFCTYSRMNISGVNGLAPIVKVFVDKTGKFQKAKVFSIKQIKGKGTFKDSNNGVYKRIQALTKQDLPEAKLKFSVDGWISEE